MWAARGLARPHFCNKVRRACYTIQQPIMHPTLKSKYISGNKQSMRRPGHARSMKWDCVQ